MNEMQRILKMVEEKKITVQEAEKLLSTIGSTKNEKSAKPVSKPAKISKIPNIKGKLKIIVSSQDGDNVNISLPLKIAKIAQSFMPQEVREKLDDEGIKINAILENIDSIIDEIDDDLVSIDSADGDKVRIFIEK